MKIFVDKDGKVNYDKVCKDETVKDVLQAMDEFLNNNPLPCDKCEESCCKKSWSVEMDNVCVNGICNWNNKTALEYVRNRLVKKKNYYREFFQFVLDKEKNCTYIDESNRCIIYEKRPIICRLYICSDKSFRYNMLRELIGSTYLRALVLENRINSNNFTERTIKKYKKNPAVFAEDYDILLEEIFKYAREEGWLDSDEEDLLREANLV
jgi:Fe-S-cluster containining protein